VIVTISREYGAAGLGVADATARILGYDLLTEELPRTVAARLGTSAEKVSESGTGQRSFTERILDNLEAGTPEAVSTKPPLPGEFDETVRREIERTMRERAAGGDVVILGRSGSAVLAGMPGLLRVFLTADRQWRIERVMETFHRTRNEAAADVDQLDAMRRKFAKERYKFNWGDARSYDLVLDTSRFGIEGAAQLIAAAVRNLEAQ